MIKNQINTYFKGESDSNRLTFVDLFAGIGGFRLGMTRAGFKPVGWCEIDRFAQQTYRANFNTEEEWFADDITKVDPEEMPDFDILCGGFPCQAFSIAGKRRGFEDTRGTLFFEIARITKQKQPRFLFLENVKGLLSHNKGETFLTILSTLDELGYDCQWQVLNSKDFGVPQNRERVFIIGHFRGTSRPEIFPFTSTNPKSLIQLIGGHQGYRVDDVDGTSSTLTSATGGAGAKTGLYAIPCFTLTGQDIRIKEATSKGYTEAVPGDSVNFQFPESKTRRGRVGKGIANTLETCSNQGVVVPKYIPTPEDINNTLHTGGRGSLSARHNYEHIFDGLTIRRLTPLECFRLQGFPDSHFNKAKQAGLSDSQLYKQAGNAVTVNVIEAIASNLKREVN